MNEMIRRTALSSVRHNKSRSILSGIAIFLTTALLMIVATCSFGFLRYEKANVKAQYGDYHACIAKDGRTQYEQTARDTQVETAGYVEKVMGVEAGDMAGNFYAGGGAVEEMMNIRFDAGSMPRSQDEIAAPAVFLEALGAKAEVGAKVEMTYRVQGKGEITSKEFTVSGILPSRLLEDSVKRYTCYVSEEFAQTYIQDSDARQYVYFKLKCEEQEMNSEQMKQLLHEFAQRMGVLEKELGINTYYINFALKPSLEVIITGIGFGLLIVCFAALVIYNIFNVGMIGRIQEFGKLRAIGAQKRQLRGIVALEGMLLCAAAVPPGILAGYLISAVGFDALIYKTTAEMLDVQIDKVPLFHPVIVLFVILAVIITIFISMRKPMKMAAGVSPVDAIRFDSGNIKTGKKMRKGHDSVSVAAITFANLAQNKRRTAVTILTMGLSSVLFVMIANVGASLSAEDLTRRDMEKGDFSITLHYSTHDDTYPENNLNALQQQNLLGQEIQEQIRAIDGVEKVEARNGFLIKEEGRPEDSAYSVVSAMSREEFESRREEWEAGEQDYDELVRTNGLVYTYSMFLEEEGYQIGGELVFQYYDGQKQSAARMPVAAATSSADTTFIVPEEVFGRMGFSTDMTIKLFVYCSPATENEVDSVLHTIFADSEHISITSYRELLRANQLVLRITIWPIYGLLAVLGIIGFMNMANTMITGMVTRKREIGILQAIGMSSRQLNHMCQLEGMLFTAGTLVLSMTIGNVLGYLLFRWMKDSHLMGIKFYHFPAAELLVFTVSIVLLQLILSFIMSRDTQKESVIERIRYYE